MIFEKACRTLKKKEGEKKKEGKKGKRVISLFFQTINSS
jgi:hypothetical protein